MADIIGTLIDETLYGTPVTDFISGQGGDDRLFGYEGDDILVGDYGNDNLTGGTGADAMFGGFGNDTYGVDSIYDSVTEIAGAGIDAVFSSVNWTLSAHVENLGLNVPDSVAIIGRGNGLANLIVGNNLNNQLYGLGGNDSLQGGQGDDQLFGGVGNDTLRGDDGNDKINGGAGSDYLIGSTGADQYIYTQADVTLAATDTIRFNPYDGDRINLAGIDAIAGGANNAFNFIGVDAFSGTAGELRAVIAGGWSIGGGPNQGFGVIVQVSGDVDGDGVADFNIYLEVDGNRPFDAPLDVGDFIL